MSGPSWRTAVLAPGLALGLLAAGASAVRAQEKGAATQGPEAAAVKNPFTGQPEAVTEGRRLFFKFNCYGCHGTQGGGGMGPSLIDSEWRYGGEDGKVFESIKNGRPNGMPAFGALLKEEEIWKLIAYLRSLYKGDSTKVVW